jgi:DNA-binding NarL/FixJ family response regulator
MMERPVRILLADDHDIVRRGLRVLLEERPGWQVVAEATNGRTALELALEHKPDIVILDVTMPELNGLETTRRIRKELSRTEVLIFTMHENEELIRDVLAAGARGYLMKSDAPKHIVAAVEALLKHKPFFTWRVSETLLERYLSAEDPGSVEPLTSREREIVQLLAEGRSNKAIATVLGISVKTVETHRAAAMRKLGASSLAELVRYAVRNRLIEA